nr:MAG TPA: hypothetical protein [Caudoviricetes sp.]
MKELKLTDEEKKMVIEVLGPLIEKIEQKTKKQENKKPLNPLKELYDACDGDLDKVYEVTLRICTEAPWFDKFDPRDIGFEDRLEVLANQVTYEHKKAIDESLDENGKVLLMILDLTVSKVILLDLMKNLQYTNSNELLSIFTLAAYRKSFTRFLNIAMELTKLPFETIAPFIAGKFIAIINEINSSWYDIPKSSEITFHEVSGE